VESSDDAIISKDLNGVIMTWNEGARRLFGWSAEEAVGQSIMMIIPPDHQDEEPEILTRLRRGERIEHFETVRQRKDGSRVDLSLTISPVRDGEGRVIGASKIARDITERKQTQEALARRLAEQAALYRLTERLHRARSAEELHAAGLDAIVDALGCDRASILLLDEEGMMRFVAWRGLSDGYRPAVEGHSPWVCDVNDPDPVFVGDAMRADLPQSLEEVVKGEGIGALGFIPLVTGGRLIGKFMAYYNAPHEFTEAETGIALTIARQLGFTVQRMRTEQARLDMQEQLRQSERRLQMALEAGRMGAWEWDIKSGRVIWSPGVEELHGLEPGAFGGTFEEFQRYVHPDDAAMVEKRIRKALKTLDDYHVVYRIRRPDGVERWVEGFGKFVVEGGEPVQLAGVCMDVTERKESELQRSLLVAELSHRVKNTLATVISVARQSFAGNADAEEAQRSFNARIRALGQTHSRLAETSWSGVGLETLLADELAPYSSGGNVRLAGPAALLGPKQALTLGMAVHELATNAAKYGALSTSDGLVEVEWTVNADRQLRIRWRESGGPAVSPPSRSGFGRLLIERVLAADLGGTVQTDFAKEGLTCTIITPLGDPAGAMVS
jgi:PAS domain S-box-containing protein